jgi:hypothetical protein
MRHGQLGEHLPLSGSLKMPRPDVTTLKKPNQFKSAVGCVLFWPLVRSKTKRSAVGPKEKPRLPFH